MIPPTVTSAINRADRFPRRGLVAWYCFDSGSIANDVVGTTISDHTNNHNFLTAVGSPTYVDAVFNKGVKLIDTSNQMLTGSNSTSLDITGPFTLACWCNLGAYPGNNQYPNLIGKVTDYTGYCIFYSGGPGGTGGFITQIGHGGSWYNSIAPFYNPLLNTWHHLATTYDGTLVKFYVDGALNSSVTHSSIYPVSNTAGLVLAAHYSNPAAYGYINCIIDDARVYNVCLTDAEIATFAP